MHNRRLLAALSACALVVAGCARAETPTVKAVDKAATVVPIAGTNRVRVQLSAEAVKRLDVQTGTVRDTSVAARPTAPATTVEGATGPPPTRAPTVRRVVPFSAVMYAPTGDAFTYVSAGPRLYERTPVVVEYVVGDLAVLASGPAAGTAVVTVGGPELSGAELGTGE